MENTPISILLNKYKQERKTLDSMTYEQFEQLMLFFPGVLITASDGTIDEEEWVYIKYLARFTASVFKEEVSKSELEELQESYFREFKFLLENLSDWEDVFLNSLKEHLEDNEEEKETVLDALYLFAEASDGTSNEETEAIQSLTEKLNLQ